jgi:uncharacterized protein with HEPN domain
MRPSERTSEDYLQDVLDYIEKAERFMAPIPNADALARDEKTLLAVVRALEVIGEAAKQVAPVFVGNTLRSRGGAWPECATRSFMDTSELDAAVVWRTVKEDLPRVREATRSLLSG